MFYGQKERKENLNWKNSGIAATYSELQFEKQSGPIPPTITNVDLVVVSRIQAAEQQHNIVCSGGGGRGGGTAYFSFWSGKYRQNERNVDEGIVECLD